MMGYLDFNVIDIEFRVVIVFLIY